MSLVILASALGGRLRAARSPAERAVERFAPVCRPAVARLATRDPRLADLAASFPALLHRLAVEPLRPRSQGARAVVLAGQPLKQAAAAAGLPFWTRRLPPESFGRTSPELPDGEEFSRRVLNCLPSHPRFAATWLEAVTEAAIWGDDDVVLWTARERGASGGSRVLTAATRLTALFAWFSARPETHAGSLAREPWREELSATAAIDRARDWLDEVEVALVFPSGAVQPWLEPGEVDGFEFCPVVTAADLAAEAQAMQNCVRDYAWAIWRGDERIWSVRRQGERVACLSVQWYEDEAPFPILSELKGEKNGPAPPEVWFAARRWLDAQTPERSPRPADQSGNYHRRVWRATWKPYWLARRRLPPELPLKPSSAALNALRAFEPNRRRRVRR